MDRIGTRIAPTPRFWAALIAMPGFLLLDSLLLKFVFMALYAVLARSAGKRIQWPYFIILISSITFFHLLVPMGRVLLKFGPFTITEDALIRGLNKGIGLTGMIFLSIFAVSPNLKIPGTLGGLLGRTFYYFHIIIDGKHLITWKHFFKSLNQLLMDRLDSRPSRPENTETAGLTEGFAGWGWAVVTALIPWAIWLLQRKS